MPPLIDLTHEKFHRLTVLRRNTEAPGVQWLCQCSCGNITSVTTSHLKSGHTKSCGCFNVEKSTERCVARGNKEQSKYNALYSHYKRNAERRGIPFLLTQSEVISVIHKPCYYCGCVESDTFARKEKDYTIKHNGMDRVDPAKGYELTNIVPCCKTCNFAKHTMTQAEFYDWIKRVSIHLQLA